MLAYRIPREPSAPRIAVWRKLKRLGVAQLLDGLVALPLDARNREQLEWIAEEIHEVAGTATVWIGSPTTRAEERAIVDELQRVVAQQYEKVAEESVAAQGGGAGGRRALGRLRRELARIERRDYFPSGSREAARVAVEDLASFLDATEARA